MQEVQYFERDEESVGDCWHADEDYKSFKANNKEAIRTVHKTYLYLSLCSDQVQVDDADALKCCMVGIKNLPTSMLITKTRTRRERRLQAVLIEQQKQDKEGNYDPVKLAQVSQKYSRWSIERSHMIGLIQTK